MGQVRQCPDFSKTARISDAYVTLILSHWPSRLYKPHHDADRAVYGAELRNILSRTMREDRAVDIVLAGDYNDEPFDAPIASHLLASRDASRLANTELVVYNPFWRSLGTHVDHLNKPPETRVAGTYRYRSRRETSWYTFDQMMFTRSFLFGGRWRLVEAETGVIATPQVSTLICEHRSKFDHLPIIGTIEAN